MVCLNLNHSDAIHATPAGVDRITQLVFFYKHVTLNM